MGVDGEFTQQDIDESKLAVFSHVKYINISLRPRNYVVLGLLFAHCLGQASALWAENNDETSWFEPSILCQKYATADYHSHHPKAKKKFSLH